MVVVNTESIPGKNYVVLSLVSGVCIQSKNIGRDIGSSFRNVVGGEMKSYMDMLDEAKEKAIANMIARAESMGADAIVNVRLTSSSIIQGGAEMVAYGTAVRFT